VITKILAPKRRPNSRAIYLDGVLSFSCNVNVVARFRLRLDMTLTDKQLNEIRRGELRQKCFDKAMRSLQSRLHSRAELFNKLMRQDYGEAVVNDVLDDLSRLGYVNDEQFAMNKALSAAQYKNYGPDRGMVELLKSGVRDDVARHALERVYYAVDSTASAQQLVRKKAPSLLKLDPNVARRRLVGMLQRRGFDHEAIKSVVDEAIGQYMSDE
jgi:regulatory protein